MALRSIFKTKPSFTTSPKPKVTGPDCSVAKFVGRPGKELGPWWKASFLWFGLLIDRWPR